MCFRDLFFHRQECIFIVNETVFEVKILNTVNVLKVRTLKNNYFSAVRNFRNYVSEKVLVFVILECGLYHEQKRYICM